MMKNAVQDLSHGAQWTAAASRRMGAVRKPPAVTLDMNCVIDLEEERQNAPHIRDLLRRHSEGAVRLSVPAIGGSERQPGGTYAENFSHFRRKLAAVGLGTVELLQPPIILDVTFLDWSIVINDAMEQRIREVQRVLFPHLPYDYGDYCASRGIERKTPMDRKWMNARCDALALWSHLHYRGDVFVTSDQNFHAGTKKPALLALGAGAIVYPAGAARAAETVAR